MLHIASQKPTHVSILSAASHFRINGRVFTPLRVSVAATLAAVAVATAITTTSADAPPHTGVAPIYVHDAGSDPQARAIGSAGATRYTFVYGRDANSDARARVAK